MSSLYGTFRTKTFSETWKTLQDFLNDYTASPIPKVLSQDNIELTYYLLYTKYGNSHKASSDPNQFKFGIFTTIWQYGATWQKKVEIQDKLRSLSESEILAGTKQIYNSANNPDTDPSTFSDEELQFISGQNVTKTKKGKLEGYSTLWSLLVNDVTEEYLNKFKKLFLTIVEPEIPLLYEEEGDENNDWLY